MSIYKRKPFIITRGHHVTHVIDTRDTRTQRVTTREKRTNYTHEQHDDDERHMGEQRVDSATTRTTRESR
jgi:hypothetical protein